MERNLNDICEAAVVELEAANRMLDAVWERNFGWIKEPEHWKTDYCAISAQMTAYKLFMDRITETLLTAYGMAPEHCASDYKLLCEEAAKMWPEHNEKTA